MTRYCGAHGGCLLALALALASSAARASPESPQSPQSSPFRLDASSEFSVVRAPFFTRNLPLLQAHGFVLELSASAAVWPGCALGARVPLALMSIRQPAGSFVDETVLGNPAASVTCRSESIGRTRSAWVGLELGLPLAQQGPSTELQRNRALEAANAAESYFAPELFTPATLPAVIRGGARLSRQPLSAESEISLPLLVRIRAPELPPEATVHRMGVLPSLKLTFAAQLSARVRMSQSIQAAVAVARVYEPWFGASRVQPSLRSGVHFGLAPHLALEASFLVPVAGVLGGAAYTGAVSLEAR